VGLDPQVSYLGVGSGVERVEIERRGELQLNDCCVLWQGTMVKRNSKKAVRSKKQATVSMAVFTPTRRGGRTMMVSNPTWMKKHVQPPQPVQLSYGPPRLRKPDPVPRLSCGKSVNKIYHQATMARDAFNDYKNRNDPKYQQLRAAAMEEAKVQNEKAWKLAEDVRAGDGCKTQVQEGDSDVDDNWQDDVSDDDDDDDDEGADSAINQECELSWR
jgi:hypothetical protein